jgi:hypothetical protein
MSYADTLLSRVLPCDVTRYLQSSQVYSRKYCIMQYVFIYFIYSVYQLNAEHVFICVRPMQWVYARR